jgi:hypothetical protein
LEEHLIHYWKGVKLAKLQELVVLRMLNNRFWPIAKGRFINNGEVLEEFDVHALFVGHRYYRLAP